MPKTQKFPPACSEKKFNREIVVLPNIIASEAIMQRANKVKGVVDLSDDHYNWFCNFADWWVRWFYRNDPKWTAELKKDDPRDFLETWIGHWADAFLKEGPDAYIAKKRADSANSPDPEWKPGGMLA